MHPLVWRRVDFSENFPSEGVSLLSSRKAARCENRTSNDKFIRSAPFPFHSHIPEKLSQSVGLYSHAFLLPPPPFSLRPCLSRFRHKTPTKTPNTWSGRPFRLTPTAGPPLDGLAASLDRRTRRKRRRRGSTATTRASQGSLSSTTIRAGQGSLSSTTATRAAQGNLSSSRRRHIHILKRAGERRQP